jgi:hypothetical protein
MNASMLYSILETNTVSLGLSLVVQAAVPPLPPTITEDLLHLLGGATPVSALSSDPPAARLTNISCAE